MNPKDPGRRAQSGPKGFQMVGEPSGPGPEGLLPPMTFGTFVLSLSTSALVHMGEGVDAEAGTAPPNLPLAQQTIEILEMIEGKTRGNLDEDEARLLEAVLHDLRMRYVRVRAQSKG